MSKARSRCRTTKGRDGRPATPIRRPRHVPVMLDEIVALLAPAARASATPAPRRPRRLHPRPRRPRGGAARACPDAHLVGLDRDPQALALAGERLAPYGDRVTLVEAVYDELPEVLARLGRPRVQAVLLDLGLSSLQIDDTGRGFAYAVDAPLDMRMGGHRSRPPPRSSTPTRARELARILRRYGEERFADRIARRIVAAREVEPFDTLRPAGRAALRPPSRWPPARPAATRPSGPSRRCGSRSTASSPRSSRCCPARSRRSPSAAGSPSWPTTRSRTGWSSRCWPPVPPTARRAGLPVVPPGARPELRLLTRGAQRPTDGRGRRQPARRLRPAPRGRTDPRTPPTVAAMSAAMGARALRAARRRELRA